MITLKAFCLSVGLTNCGIVTEVFQNGKSLGDGLVTFSEVSQTLASETGLRAFTIPKADFLKIFESDAFEFDVELVLPNDPDKPQPECKADKFEFVTKWNL
jgi:hypothetical protein